MSGKKDVWRVRTVVSTVTAVAALSFMTGILNIEVAVVSGPIADYVPLWLQQASGFSGTLTGFLMLASALGLRRRLKAGWYLALLLLPLTALQGLIQSSILSYPLVLLSLVSIPGLVSTRKHFTRKSSLTPIQTASLVSVVGAQIYGTVGALALQRGFSQDLTLLDAFYYSIVTSSTVGYGDIVPQTPETRLFTITVIVLGTTTFAAAIGSLLTPLLEAKLSKRFEKLEEEVVDIIEEEIEQTDS